MLFVATLTLREGKSSAAALEALQKHQGWEHPTGLKVVADYYLSGTPEIIVIFEADIPEPIYAFHLNWADLFDVRVHPAMPLDQAIKAGRLAYGLDGTPG